MIVNILFKLKYSACLQGTQEMVGVDLHNCALFSAFTISVQVAIA